MPFQKIFVPLCVERRGPVRKTMFHELTETMTKKKEVWSPLRLTVDDLYISPLAMQRHYDDEGRRYYVPLERRTAPTGVALIDELMGRWSRGDMAMGRHARLLGCDARDMSGFLRVLTGMGGDEFRELYQQRLLDELLRYTDLTLEEVARRSGIGTQQNLCLFTKRLYHCTPQERRRRLQRPGDAGRYTV